MDYRTFANGFSFRLLQPDKPFTRWHQRAKKWLGRFGRPYDFVNTRFPKETKGIKKTLRPLGDIPRMSTVGIAALIHQGVRQMQPEECFVNVGVWNGFTFLSGLIGNPDRRCIGVDNFSQFGGPRDAFLERFNKFKSPKHDFHDMDYKEYFATVHQGPIGFYLYDGEHSYANQMDGLRVAEPFFSPKCIIMVDDTNTDDPRNATLDFIKNSPNKYELFLDARTCENQHPTWWNGVMLLQRVG